MKKHDELSKSRIEQLEKEREEWKNKYLRALADYQNLEKRTQVEKEETRRYAGEQIIHELLAVLDTFEKAQQHLNDAGLKLALAGFYAVLTRHGVKRIEVLHKKFDPQEMECVEAVTSDREDEVVEEVRAGYRIGDKVMRVAQVKVGKQKIDKKAEELAQKELVKGDYML